MQTLLIFFCLAVLLTTCILMVYVMWKLIFHRVPLVTSGGKVAQKMVEIAELSAGQKIVDLGSGVGTILFAAEKSAPKNRFLGLEVLIFAIWFCRIKSRIIGSKIEFQSADFFEENLDDADVIFCYLFPETMEKIYETIWPNLKVGSKIVSHGFQIRNLKPEKIEKLGRAKIFLYVKGG